MPVLEEIKKSDGSHHGWAFYCPACKWAHELDRRWKFDGNKEKPTFTPSLRVNFPADGVRHCHLLITAGMIRYEPDSGHELKGKTVPMVEFKWSEA